MSASALPMRLSFRNLDEKDAALAAIETAAAEQLRQRRLEHIADSVCFAIRLAAEEVLVNHLKHGHQFDDALTATVEVRMEGDTLVVESEDQGPGYNPADVPDCTDEQNLERPCGRGVALIDGFTAKWGGTVAVLGRGNRTRITFLLAEPPKEA